MDIAGAKALKERLGQKGSAEAPAVSVDISADAPPVYHYLDVADVAPETPAAAPDTRIRLLLRRLGLTSG